MDVRLKIHIIEQFLISHGFEVSDGEKQTTFDVVQMYTNSNIKRMYDAKFFVADTLSVLKTFMSKGDMSEMNLIVESIRRKALFPSTPFYSYDSFYHFIVKNGVVV